MSTHLPKLQEILAEQLGIDEDVVTPTSRLYEDLGADSLDCVEITMAIEEEWSIDIPNETEDGWRTVQDILDYLDRMA